MDADQVSGLSADAIGAILAARVHSVSYTVGDNGELSMTITNRLDMVSSGYFYVGVEMMGSATAIPVPEPEAYLCMLLGLGALGGFARWRATA